MGDTTRATSAVADLEPRKQYEQPQSSIYPVPIQPYNFQQLHKELSQFSSCQRRPENFTGPKQPQGVPFSKSEEVQRVVDDVELPWQASRLTTNPSPYSLPNNFAPNIELHLPVNPINQSVPNSNLNTGLPTALYFPVPSQNLQGPSRIVVVDGLGIRPQWSAEQLGMYSCWYDQSHLGSSSPFQPSNTQLHYSCQHPTAAPLLQHPHFLYNHWYPAFPLVNISHGTMGTHHNTAAFTSAEGIAPRVWGVSSPIYPISALNTGQVSCPQAPLPTTSTSDTLSALFSSPRESNGSSVSNSSPLQLAAGSGFSLVRQEIPENTQFQGQTSRGSCTFVGHDQNTANQPFSCEFVVRDQQLGASPTQQDQPGGRTKHPGHLFLVENDISTVCHSKGSSVCSPSDQSTMSYLEESPVNSTSTNQPTACTPSSAHSEGWIKGPVNCTMKTPLGLPDFYIGSSPHLVVLTPPLNACSASSPGLICAPVNQEYLWNSMRTGQPPRETKTPGISKISSVVSPVPSDVHDTRAAKGRNTVQKHSGKGQWGIADDRLLIKLVNTYGTRRWSLIATFMSNRLGKQCRERWVNHLQPNIRKEDWTPEEEQLLVRAHATFGNRWSAIAKVLPGRTDNSIKNHWHAALRKKGRHGPYRPSLLRDYIHKQTGACCEDRAQNLGP